VRQKLLQWHATPEQTDEIIAHLQNARFIDEQRYCHAFVHDKLLYQGWGRIKIRVQLQAKNLPSKNIEQALQEIDDTEYFRILDQLMASKQRTIKTTDPQAREKTIRFLMQRGFTYEEISLRIK
jgi:regulatory protein